MVANVILWCWQMSYRAELILQQNECHRKREEKSLMAKSVQKLQKNLHCCFFKHNMLTKSRSPVFLFISAIVTTIIMIWHQNFEIFFKNVFPNFHPDQGLKTSFQRFLSTYMVMALTKNERSNHTAKHDFKHTSRVYVGRHFRLLQWKL